VAFCASCGSQVEGKFCAKCGAVVGGPAAGASAPPPPPPPGYAPPAGYPPPAGGFQQQAGYQQPGYQPGYQPPPAAAGLTDNAASALCYALGFITGILFLVLEPYNRNRAIRFHAFQSIFFSAGVTALYIVMGIVSGILFASGGLYSMWWLWALVWGAIRLACFVLWLVVIVTVYQGKPMVLPVIGPLAQKQAGA
jgi:uncharacterized membrane protein